MSPFQQAQMFSLQDANIHNLAITGVFDDCQDIVKAVSNDLGFKRKYRIGTVNSINWARLLAQVVYYFAGYFQATAGNDKPVSFAVPSGNFGNICAGHVARMMGLPIDSWWSPPTRTTCSTSSSAPASTACAARPTRTRPPARRWTSARPATSSASCSTCWARRRQGAPAVRGRPGRQGQLRPVRRPGVRQAADALRLQVSGKSTHADRLATIRDTYQALCHARSIRTPPTA
jgi:threonine synthase